ncbi:MAG: phosphoglycerate kinase, partial [Alphaproteobacteria bacterium]|nr:phosphoglycerate kinase [Alphaproteobacteria bacterium]
MPTLKTLNDIGDIKGKRVIVRATLNVPAKDGVVLDNTRIVRFAPTAKLLADKGAKVIILTHFGRPEGVDPEFSVGFMVPELSKAIGKVVGFAADCVGEVAKETVAKMDDGNVLLLENTRFHKEETANDPAFAKELASLGDIFVNDAFADAHRAHASTEGITKFLPSYAGLLMEEEVNALAKALDNPARPSTAIVAGAKISTKISVLENIAQKVDNMLIGGAMANTFLMAEGFPVGKSLVEADMLDIARKVKATSKAKIVLPVDVVVAKEIKDGAAARTVAPDAVAADDIILDIGAKSIELFNSVIDESKTVLFNGTVGLSEMKPFDIGSASI